MHDEFLEAVASRISLLDAAFHVNFGGRSILGQKGCKDCVLSYTAQKPK